VHNFIRDSGLLGSGSQLRVGDVEALLESLVYDSHLEVNQPSIHGDDRLYRLMPRLPSIDGLVASFTLVPACECLTCKCIEPAQPGDRYTPCPNLSAWLNRAANAPKTQKMMSYA
jgi:hypothetical protein